MFVALFLWLERSWQFSFENLQWICLILNGVCINTRSVLLLFTLFCINFSPWSDFFCHSTLTAQVFKIIIFLSLAVFLCVRIFFEILIFQWLKFFNSLFPRSWKFRLGSGSRKTRTILVTIWILKLNDVIDVDLTMNFLVFIQEICVGNQVWFFHSWCWHFRLLLCQKLKKSNW